MRHHTEEELQALVTAHRQVAYFEGYLKAFQDADATPREKWHMNFSTTQDMLEQAREQLHELTE